MAELLVLFLNRNFLSASLTSAGISTVAVDCALQRLTHYVSTRDDLPSWLLL